MKAYYVSTGEIVIAESIKDVIKMARRDARASFKEKTDKSRIECVYIWVHDEAEDEANGILSGKYRGIIIVAYGITGEVFVGNYR